MLKDKIILIALHKPKGFICTHKDEFNRKKAIDLIPKKTFQTIKGKIHSVGRLDYNSQGLLLLTNNTKIKHYLESPSNKIIRIYKVKVQGIVDKKIIQKLLLGYRINNFKYKPIKAYITHNTKTYTWLMMTLTEGKNREIRNIFESLNLTVTRLIRVSYGKYKFCLLYTSPSPRDS